MLVTATERTAVSGVALGRSCLFSLIFWLIKRLVDCCVSVNVFLLVECFLSIVNRYTI
jgi:hypothetical protein